jgi:hypothetical protein
MGIIDYL